MRIGLLTLILLLAPTPAAFAQATRSDIASDTITIISATSSPAQVRLVNTGAHVGVTGPATFVLDTIWFSTPLSVIVPHTKFSLAIVAMPGSGEARAIFPPRAGGATMERSFQVTVVTPLRLERTEDDAPLTLQSTNMEAHRVP